MATVSMRCDMTDHFAAPTLFDLPPVKPRDLFEEFGMPPFSIDAPAHGRIASDAGYR